MTADTLITIILAHAFTKAEVHRHLWRIRTYLEQRWFGSGTSGTLEEFYSHEGASDRERAVATALMSEIGGLSKETVYPVLEGAEESVKALPYLSISIPYPSDDAAVVGIGTWFRNNVHDRIVIDMTTDPSVVGGCAVAYRGYRHDLALHRAITKNKEKIRLLLHDYAGKTSG